jgi:hypothetical protein
MGIGRPTKCSPNSERKDPMFAPDLPSAILAAGVLALFLLVLHVPVYSFTAVMMIWQARREADWTAPGPDADAMKQHYSLSNFGKSWPGKLYFGSMALLVVSPILRGLAGSLGFDWVNEMTVYDYVWPFLVVAFCGMCIGSMVHHARRP